MNEKNELLNIVLKDLGKTPEDFDKEVAEMQEQNPNDVQKLQGQNAELNLQVMELWETLIDAGVI